MNSAVLAGLTAGLAGWCLAAVPSPARPAGHDTGGSGVHLQRRAAWLAAGAALGAGLLAWWAAPLVFAIARAWLLRTAGATASTTDLRDLPLLVTLMIGPLRAGASPTEALRRAAAALRGPAADRVAQPLALLEVGVDAEAVWARVAEDPDLGDLGRAMVRSQRSGASVSDAVSRLAAELSATAAAEVENRARTVGVRAAVPLGVCLLPAFLLLGVTPLAVGLFAQVT